MSSKPVLKAKKKKAARQQRISSSEAEETQTQTPVSGSGSPASSSPGPTPAPVATPGVVNNPMNMSTTVVPAESPRVPLALLDDEAEANASAAGVGRRVLTALITLILPHILTVSIHLQARRSTRRRRLVLSPSTEPGTLVQQHHPHPPQPTTPHSATSSAPISH